MFILIFFILTFCTFFLSRTHILKISATLKKLVLVFMLFFIGLNFSIYAANEIPKEENKSFFAVIKQVDHKITSILDSIKDYKINSVGFFKTEIPANEVFMTSDNFLVYANDHNIFIDGTITERDEDGNIISAIKVKKGLPHGKFREYYPPYDKHILKNEGKYKNGFLNGKKKSYFENGEIESVVIYSGGVLDGAYKEYYINGKLKTKGKYKKGKKNGQWTYYYQSGKKELQGKYKNDKKIKVWKFYDNNGNVKDEVRHSFF